MEIIEYKNYDQKYLSEVVELWNKQLVYDPITIKRFEQIILFDENFNEELFKLALNNDKVVGFIWGVKRKFPYLERGTEPERGWINFVAVDEDYQGLKIAKKLIELEEEQLKSMGTKEVTLCAYSPNYLNPGIDLKYEKGISLFEKVGYDFKGEAVSMQRTLWDFTLNSAYKEKVKKLNEEGIKLLHYHDAYYSKIINFTLDNFGAGWKRNVLHAMQNNTAEDTIILCVDKNDDIIGYCMRSIDDNENRFGPIGVKEELRSKGLGGILLETMMYDMKKHGINDMYFLWTDGPAQRFYERHGLSVYRTYRLYRKKV
jgi:ribosomal protein S18 acetylase RimI-like enzyme